MQTTTKILPAVAVLFFLLAPCRAGRYPVEQWSAWRSRNVERYPQASWLRYATPEEAGWSSAKLQQAKEYFDHIGSAAAMVVFDGAVLVQWGQFKRRFMCHSVRKSYLSALYGIHVRAGTIDLNKTLADLNIDDQPPLTDSEKQARLVDLLRSCSGVYHTAAYETAKMKQQRPPRGSHPPGSFFWYNNWDFNALCTIFKQETGAGVFQQFLQRIAEPLQMQDFRIGDTYYHLERHHSIHSAYPFRMSARDMARFGLLFLRRGKWNDRQVIPESWVRESTESRPYESTSAPGSRYRYAYLWWDSVGEPFRELGMYSARGYGGHSIEVLPKADLVFVHRVDTYWDLNPHLKLQGTSVKDSQRLKLLEMILDARVSKPQTDPKLVAVAESPRRADLVSLDACALGKYVGEYRFKDFSMRVERQSSSLSIRSPEMGRFGLLPLSKTKFIMEDAELPVAFELDEEGSPMKITIDFAEDCRCVGQPATAH